MKKFILISPKNRTVYNFRGDLVKKIISEGYKVYVTGPDSIDVEKIENLGATFKLIPNDKNGVSVIADILYFFKLLFFLLKVKPDVVLSYTIKPVIYGSIASWLSGVKSINSMITGVGYLFTSQTKQAKILKKIASFLYKIGLKCSDHVIFQNSDDKSDFIDHCLVSSKKTFVVNGSGVNMNKFLPTPYPEKLTFFMLSRALYSKGVLEFAKAAKKVKLKYPKVRFMFLGAFENIQDSIPEDSFKSEYIDTGILDYFGETTDVRSFYKQCSVYVLPSYREGTPRTVLEAMAMKRPIITSDAPGCRETVRHKVNGFLVPIGDVDALVASMEHYILNPESVELMGTQSYLYCKEKFRVEIVNDDMLDILFKINNETN